MKNAPSDTHMREVLDEVDPRDLRDSHLALFEEAKRGKLLLELEKTLVIKRELDFSERISKVQRD